MFPGKPFFICEIDAIIFTQGILKFMQGNLIGLGMFVIAAIVIAVGYFVLKLPDSIVMIIGGAVLILIDMILRLLKRENQGWIWRKEFGGYLFFAPVWVFGVIVIAVNAVNFFVNKR